VLILRAHDLRYLNREGVWSEASIDENSGRDRQRGRRGSAIKKQQSGSSRSNNVQLEIGRNAAALSQKPAPNTNCSIRA
jgi:hypothetical protein